MRKSACVWDQGQRGDLTLITIGSTSATAEVKSAAAATTAVVIAVLNMSGDLYTADSEGLPEKVDLRASLSEGLFTLTPVSESAALRQKGKTLMQLNRTGGMCSENNESVTSYSKIDE